MPARKQPTPKPAPVNPGFIDAGLMERAIKLRQEGKSMKAIGAELNVKATGYLARKIKAKYGPDALARPAAQAPPQAEPAKPASAQRKPARRRSPRKVPTAKGA